MASITRELPIAGGPAPGIHKSWLKALSSISTSAFPEELPSDRRYILPDPNTFIDPGTKAVRTQLLHRYLQLRPTLIQRLGITFSTIPIAVPLPGRIWRQVLRLDQSTVASALTPTSNSKVSKAAGECFHAAVFLLACVDATKATTTTTLATILSSPPIFQGEEISPDALSDSGLAKQVLWELAELNFRIELGALNERLSRDLSPNETRPDILSCVCFASAPQALLVIDLQQAYQGLASTDVRQRLPQLIKLKELFTFWKVTTPALFSLDFQSKSINAISSLESALYKFYALHFFNYFGRYPVVPRFLVQ
ncbi:hypothetical protein BKA70DRAFT_1134077 [Coprinopsis sp. MPI-PUGE-AT-0042]|nr:hypothetical protein BKA70DRAFT_1134077 [Coprinopsis sp. MPI-PUGE-AT-0042]